MKAGSHQQDQKPCSSHKSAACGFVLSNSTQRSGTIKKKDSHNDDCPWVVSMFCAQSFIRAFKWDSGNEWVYPRVLIGCLLELHMFLIKCAGGLYAQRQAEWIMCPVTLQRALITVDVEIIHEERFIPFTLLEIFLKDMTSQQAQLYLKGVFLFEWPMQVLFYISMSIVYIKW